LGFSRQRKTPPGNPQAAPGFGIYGRVLRREAALAKKNKTELGAAGEHYAAAKLSELGYAVGLTGRNMPGVDLLVSNGAKTKMIQVKTTEGPAAKWAISNFKGAKADLVFIFVNLNKALICGPSFHIVPSKKVKAHLDSELAAYEKKYLERHGTSYNEDGTKTGVSHFSDKAGSFKDQWTFLDLPLSAG
jgi:hypothetical protein